MQTMQNIHFNLSIAQLTGGGSVKFFWLWEHRRWVSFSVSFAV